MATVVQTVLPLVAGDKLSQDEFLRRWEAMPNLKRAELIGGIVYMPSPLSRDHGSVDINLSAWIATYAAYTPRCEPAGNATVLIGEDDSPQPDALLRLLPAIGGQSCDDGLYVGGAPELTAEVCLSSTSYDLNQKLELYEKAGVREYVAVLLHEREVRWHHLTAGNYELLPPDAAGVLRARVFPGLWLDARALLAGDMRKVLAKLDEGLASEEHQAFVARLKAKGA